MAKTEKALAFLHKTFSLTLLIGLMALFFFGAGGPPDAYAQGNGSRLATNPSTGVTLAITPSTRSVTVGQDFNLVVELQAGTQSVDGAAAYLNFNPTYLKVVSITPGSTLTSVLQNSYDNTLGQVNFAAGVLSNFPSGTFTLATISFHAVTAVNSTPITFNAAVPRLSDVTFGGGSVLSSKIGGTVKITKTTTYNSFLPWVIK